MDSNFLKKTLHEQTEPLDIAVQKKLAYLKSDDVFTLETNSYIDDSVYDGADDNDMSIEDAFATFASAQPHNTADTKPAGLNKIASKPLNEIKEEQATAETINAHKQNIAARIAALRGISMPGDYILKK